MATLRFGPLPTLIGLPLVVLFAIVGFSQFQIGGSAPAILAPIDASATPDSIAPPDILAISVLLQNRGPRVDGAVAAIQVVDPRGGVTREFRQGGIGIPANTRMQVSWVWRLPKDLQPGRYRILASVSRDVAVTPTWAHLTEFSVQESESQHQ